VYYTPTQAETNYTSFILIAKKTGCIPVSVTVVTSATTTSGTVLLAPTTHTSAVVPTVTDVTNQVTANMTAISGDSVAADNLEAAADGTGYNLGGGAVVAASVTGNVGGAVASVSGAVGSVTGNVGGNVAGSVGSVAGSVVGSVASVIGSVGSVAAGGITAASIATDAIDSDALAASAITEIQSGLATSASITSVDGKIDIIDTNVDTLLDRITSTLFSGITYMSRWLGAIAGKTADTSTRTEINATTAGATYNETTDSQEAIRDRGDAAWTTGAGGAGGSNIVNVFPISSSADERISNTTIIVYKDENIDVTVSVDATLTGMTLLFTVTDNTDVDILSILDADITRTANAFTVLIPDTFTTALASHTWSLRDVTGTNNVVLARGPFEIQNAP
jgi:hypothetical protein